MLYLDIHSKKPYPSCALSNFAEHPFVLDGMEVRCMEGLLQSLKVEPEMQRQVCLLDGKAAKELGSAYHWQENGGFFSLERSAVFSVQQGILEVSETGLRCHG
jgi:hypothetical protein